jgi:hypothetical protein
MATHIIKIIVTTPDEDGDWRVEVDAPVNTRTGTASGDVDYGTDLGALLPSPAELKRMIEEEYDTETAQKMGQAMREAFNG